jgi:hypothetical protein
VIIGFALLSQLAMVSDGPLGLNRDVEIGSANVAVDEA